MNKQTIYKEGNINLNLHKKFMKNLLKKEKRKSLIKKILYKLKIKK